MKAKKFIALAMSVAMAVGTASLFAACNPEDKGEGDGGSGSGDYAVDTRIWYVVGQDTKGTLSEIKWQPQNTTYKFERDTTVTDENVFTLTLDIYAGSVATGNSFKFLYKTSEDEVISDTNLWTRQVGIHAFEGMDGYEGEGVDSVIKIDGETVFTTAQDNGDDGNNMACAKGQDGTYKFTLKTKNATDTPKLSVERTAKIAVPYEMYLRGDMNNFSLQNMVAMTEKVGSGETNTTWSVQYEVTDKDLWRDENGAEVEADDKLMPVGGKYAAIQLYNSIDNKTYVTAKEAGYGLTDEITIDGNAVNCGTCMLLPKGKYTVTFDVEDKSVTVTAGTHQMYFIGNWYADPENKDDYGWGYNNGYEAYPLQEKEGGVWTGILNVPATGAELKLYNSIDGKYYTTPELTASDGNIKLNAGTYAFKFTEEGNVVEYEQCDYYLIGTFFDEKNVGYNFVIAKDVTPKLVATETEGVYTCTFEVKDASNIEGLEWVSGNKVGDTPAIFGIQVAYGSSLMIGNGDYKWYAYNGGNYYFTEAGTYTVTITFDADNKATYVVEKAGTTEETPGGNTPVETPEETPAA